jgi:hypothetical protein
MIWDQAEADVSCGHTKQVGTVHRCLRGHSAQMLAWVWHENRVWLSAAYTALTLHCTHSSLAHRSLYCPRVLTHIWLVSCSCLCQYACLQRGLRDSWRESLGGHPFPFVAVQLPGYDGDCKGLCADVFYMRLQQAEATTDDNLSSIAVTYDLSCPKCPFGSVHNTHKVSASRRAYTWHTADTSSSSPSCSLALIPKWCFSRRLRWANEWRSSCTDCGHGGEEM